MPDPTSAPRSPEAAPQADLRRLGSGGGALLAATLVGNALLLLLDMVVNGRLSAADYGWWCALRRVAALIGFVAAMGVENIVLREVARAGGGAKAAAGVRGGAALAVGVSTLLAVAMAAFAGPLAARLDGPDDGALDVLLVAASLPLASARLVAVAASQGLGRIGPRAVVMFVAWPLGQLALLVPLGALVGDRRGVVAAYLASMAFGALLAAVLAARADRALVRPGPVTPPAAVFAASWPLWLQGMIMAGYTWLDQVLLAALGGVEEAARYGPVAALAPLYGLGLTALNGMFAPMIAAGHARGDLAGMQRLYRTVTRWAVALSLPAVAVTLAVPEAILQVWPSGDPTAAGALRITALAWLGCTLVGSVNYLLIMAGHQRATLWNGIPAVGLSIGLSVWLVPAWGAVGAAVANAGAILAANGIGLWQVRRALGMHPFHPALFRPLLAAVPAGAVAALAGTLPLPPIGTCAVAGLGALLAFGAAMRLLPLDEDDRMVLDTLARKFRR